MDDQTGLIIAEVVVGIVLTVYGGTLVWLINRLLKLEDDQAAENAEINTALAVLKKGHEDLKEETRRMDKRNEIAHENFDKKLDAVDAKSQARHDRVMSRIDEALALLRNGLAPGR